MRSLKTNNILKGIFRRGKILISFLPLFLFAWVEVCSAGEVVVIVNKNQNVSHLSLSDMQYFYKGDKIKWADNERVVLFLPPPDSDAAKFLVEKILTLRSHAEISKFYLHAIFQQKIVVPPEPTLSVKDAVRRVSSTPGGVAIVDKEDLAESSSVTIIELD